ncbi:protein OPI10 homolog [Uloborus diversus]|uniref:protein OPI10 homolog n=1 Tax=Uloborus diversus TaxID=327109 RepID=UPI0024096544|nr:protein OPI10 homolog [Uloborus diversus]
MASAPMFAVIVSGRLVQTDFQPIDSTKFATNIVDADNINHIVVFLTGAQPFPEGLGGSVYFSWPDPNAAPAWQLLGFITNAKPSAIFKISKLKPDTTTLSTPFGEQPISHVAQIGISVEPLQQLELQTPITSSTPSNVDSFVEYTNKMLENFINYISSFAVLPNQIMPNRTDNYVPLSTVQQWYVNFQRRLQQNPNFWKT